LTKGLVRKKKKTSKKHANFSNKHNVIGEILGILEEKGKSKDWILEQLNRKKVKLKVSPTTNSYEILKTTPKHFLKHLHSLLKDDDFKIHEVRTLTKTFHWFFTDIVRSSDPTIDTKAQVRKINALNLQVNKAETFKNRDPASTVVYWSGDGMAIGFSDSPEKPLRLAIELHKALSRYNKSTTPKNRVHTRIGINTGPVYNIKDVEGNDAIWGDGIIFAKRVMDLCGQNQIFASSNIADDIRKLTPEYKAILHPIGDYSVKHGEQLQIYNVYGRGFGNKTVPQKDKVKERKFSLLDEKNVTSFIFKKIEIKLDVTNPKNMMTRHTWVWQIRNVRKDKDRPLEEMFYSIGGDTPKDFADLNLKVYDHQNKELKISSFATNNPYLKEFYVKFSKPIRYRKTQTLTLQYDWQEPQRKFEFQLSSECSKFRYKLSAPKSLALKNRVLKVNPGTKEKIKATPTADIKFLKNKTEVTWESKKKLKEYDCYQFDW